jgi:uncharacterized iron-regulated membrane protein
MKSMPLAITMVATATLMTMITVGSYIQAEVNAQNMTKMEDGGSYGNKTARAHQQMIINGTIDLEQTIFEAIASKVNTTLTQAISIAEGSVGNNSFALAAFSAPHDTYLVYTIILGTPGMEFYKVLVDPGSGQVLASQEISHDEWAKMQQMQHTMHGGPTGGGMMMMDERMHGPSGGGMMTMMDEGGPMKSGHGWK